MSITKRNHFREQVRLQGGLAVATTRNAAATALIDSGGKLTGDAGGVIEITDNQVATVAAAKTIYLATRAVKVVAVSEVHSAAGTDGGAVTLAVFKDTGTNAPGAGTTVLTGTINLKGTANTVQNGTVVTTAVATLAAGDRLSTKVTGTNTSLAGMATSVRLIAV